MPTLGSAQDDAADDLLGRDPLALLGMLSDQHVRRRSRCTLAAGGSSCRAR